MCLGPSCATRASAISTYYAELSEVSFLPGDKGSWLLAGLESQTECRRSIYPRPHFFFFFFLSREKTLIVSSAL